jgi:hypothetical protein
VKGDGVTPPRWAAVLNAAGGDPLKAQELDAVLSDLPDGLLAPVMRAAHGDPVRAREIVQGVNAKWWARFVEFERVRMSQVQT